MPNEIRKIIQRRGGIRKHVRFRNGIYEIRMRINGVDISAASKKFADAKAKFIEKVQRLPIEGAPTVPKTFGSFAMFYFENFRKRKVKPRTYLNDLGRLKKHLLPYFGETELKKISPLSIQNFLDCYTNEGKGKTADELHSLLNCTFKMAIAHRVLDANPMAVVFHQQHERVHGVSLTYAEEKLLLETTAGTPFQQMFAVAIYTGLRPNEYKTARLEGNIIHANNSKRHNGKTETKRIAVSPMLAHYVREDEELYFFCYKKLWMKFKGILPDHTLKDLRTTFYSRCKECNVADAARDEFMGHSNGVLGNAYTDLSNEYLIREAQKILYELPDLLPKNK